mmetsp:Transcript_31639/g.82250  ORF Transcript_31639/g.82250 Transcript_31639/m.82250 type:complete len:92 (-) Transcript_31639:365-640(-)|eukprot:CAMPEP_0202343454 /NCGR_PEP_ID=MMETSP1126-20121109/3566_1 /ASSEMBLY_ACC=CAM_ASM_000457 /TAXON_ID=3047 /ORGANISM="Dunaliella tertiolecta, Strain CCMP1320" /LENGTH=91 /DNA_ID=CAMNT_0048934521 /DNA_START=215 /DNA_END=490 /DNA_ORIENTATION=-
MGKLLGPDAVVLSIPIAGALTLFAGMIGRIFLFDPEASRSGVEFYEKEEAKDIGENYRMQYQQIFRDRVLRGARSLFNNDPAGVEPLKDKH